MEYVDIDVLISALEKSWCKETSYREYRDAWTEENPAAGQCAVTALVVNDYFGGDILHGKSDLGAEHYWNVVGSVKIDVTKRQFLMNQTFHDTEVIDRDTILSSGDVLERYAKLRFRTELMSRAVVI